MSLYVKEEGNYSVLKGDLIFHEEQEAKSLNVLLKGTVDVYINTSQETKSENSYKIFSINQNLLIGMTDLFLNKNYSFKYKAGDDTTIYSYPIKDIEDLKNLFKEKKEYSVFTIISISTMMDYFYTELLKMENQMKSLNILTENLSILFWHIKNKYNLTHVPSSLYLNEAFEKYQKAEDLNLIPRDFDPKFLENEILELTDLDYAPIYSMVEDKIKYYKEILSLPMELKKDFYSANEYIAFYHFHEAANNINVIANNLKEAIKISEKCLSKICFDDDTNIFHEFICLIKEAKKYEQNWDELNSILDIIVNRITGIAKVYKEEYDYNLEPNIDCICNKYNKIKEPIQMDTDIETIEIPEELKDSAEKIIRYSEIEKDKADILRSGLDKFRFNPEDKGIRKAIIPIFFEIYELVFKKVILEKDESRLFNMFLNFGYMDERLLTTEQILNLYKLSDNTKNENNCTVYNMKEWLSKIYSMDKDPSVNEFDQDYYDVFREKKRLGDVSEKDRLSYENDFNSRLNFELNNMFKTNHKLCYGQSDTYFPILHKDMILGNLSNAFITKEKVSDVINEILAIDYSAFHREIFYQNPKKNIEKEIISKEVIPDIILMPTFGFRGIMWQEITGRVRSTPGRFIIPIFTNENLHDMLIRVIGNFRYELCRTMMGVSWNDITISSLTSEYTDYIQFYRKNKDLSEEAKDKVKLQIQKHNNRIKSIFTADYEIWIKYEHKGYIRLNKVARSILFKYCPFAKPIREALEKNPIFNELAIPFNNIRNKMAEDLERRYGRLLNGNISEDPELEANLHFYKEM